VFKSEQRYHLTHTQKLLPRRRELNLSCMAEFLSPFSPSLYMTAHIGHMYCF